LQHRPGICNAPAAMSSRLRKFSTLVAVVILVAACGSPRRKPIVEPEPPPVVEAEPPPPPPCEALEEKCAAKDDTKARIAKTKLIFTPAAGWMYAQGTDATIAEVSSDGSAFAIAGYESDPKDAKKDAANRELAFEALAKAIGVTPPAKKKVNWKKPGDTKDVSGKKVSLFELEGAERSSKKGPMLVIHAPIADGQALLGVGFVPDDDQNGPAAIMKAVESLADAPAGEKAEKADEKADKKAEKADEKAGDKAVKADEKAGDKAVKADEKAGKTEGTKKDEPAKGKSP
jgi:hypothetical protein